MPKSWSDRDGRESPGSAVLLASSAAVYMTGQVLHPNGGEIING